MHPEKRNAVRRVGAVIGVWAGIFGILLAIITVFGGQGLSFLFLDLEPVIKMGHAGFYLSLLTVVLAGLCVEARSETPGIFLVATAVLGIVLGGPLVAVCMLFALAGGILTLVGTMSRPTEREV